MLARPARLRFKNRWPKPKPTRPRPLARTCSWIEAAQQLTDHLVERLVFGEHGPVERSTFTIHKAHGRQRRALVAGPADEHHTARSRQLTRFHDAGFVVKPRHVSTLLEADHVERASLENPEFLHESNANRRLQNRIFRGSLARLVLQSHDEDVGAEGFVGLDFDQDIVVTKLQRLRLSQRLHDKISASRVGQDPSQRDDKHAAQQCPDVQSSVLGDLGFQNFVPVLLQPNVQVASTDFGVAVADRGLADVKAVSVDVGLTRGR